MKRTPAEILGRIEDIKRDDWMGTQTWELVKALSLTHAQPFVKEEAWADWEPTTEEEFRAEAKDYLSFAVDKATNHRGLSAGRSIDHFAGWLWLLEPELYAGFAAAPYENYGVPKLKAAALALGLGDEWVRLSEENPELEPMSNGRPCRPDCDEGCGR